MQKFDATHGEHLGILNLMYAGRPYTVIRDSVQVHPTVSELIPTMMESLEPASHQ